MHKNSGNRVFSLKTTNVWLFFIFMDTTHGSQFWSVPRHFFFIFLSPGDNWHLTPDTWHITCFTWHTREDDNFEQISSPWVLRFECEGVSKIFEQKDHLLIEWINYKGVCRTAPATLGLLIMPCRHLYCSCGDFHHKYLLNLFSISLNLLLKI